MYNGGIRVQVVWVLCEQREKEWRSEKRVPDDQDLPTIHPSGWFPFVSPFDGETFFFFSSMRSDLIIFFHIQARNVFIRSLALPKPGHSWRRVYLDRLCLATSPT